MKEYCGYPHEETCYHDGESEKTIHRDCEGCEWVTVTEPRAPKSQTPFGLLERFVMAWRRRYRYWKHERNHRLNGDTRDEFEKYVDKCRILELNKDIHNWHDECL